MSIPTISQKISKCKECSKPLAVYFLDGVLIKSKQYPGTEEMCKDCLPAEVRQEIDKKSKNLRKKVVDGIGCMFSRSSGNIPPDAN